MRYHQAFIGLILVRSASAAYTAVSYFPENAIYQIDGDDGTAEKVLDTEDVTAISITNDPVTGFTYVITGDTAGEQKLNRFCNGELLPIVPISPSSVNLYCLTSGPNGVYAVESTQAPSGEVSLGKLDTSSGEWTEVAPIAAPISSVVVAQNSKGIIHHVNGNGKLFTNDGTDIKNRVSREAKFPPGFANFCGEFFDDRNIISTTDNKDGGYAVYKFNKEIIKLTEVNGGGLFFNDITMTNDDELTSCKSAPLTVAPGPTAPMSSKGKGKKKNKNGKNSKKNRSGKKNQSIKNQSMSTGINRDVANDEKQKKNKSN